MLFIWGKPELQAVRFSARNEPDRYRRYRVKPRPEREMGLALLLRNPLTHQGCFTGSGRRTKQG